MKIDRTPRANPRGVVSNGERAPIANSLDLVLIRWNARWLWGPSRGAFPNVRRVFRGAYSLGMSSEVRQVAMIQ